VSDEWTYKAQNLVTREWVDPDLELRDVEIIDELSGPGGLMASIAPELRAATRNGERILKEWQTAIYAQDRSGQIRGAGILVHSEPQDDTQRWDLECPGWTAYPTGIAYDGELSWWEADPFDVVRHLWAHLQSYDHGDLGMVVSNAKSSVRLGPPQPPARPADYVKTELKAPLKGNKPNKGSQPKRKRGESDNHYALRVQAWEQDWFDRVDAWEADYLTRKAQYDEAKIAQEMGADYTKSLQELWDDQYGDHKPYELSWWEAPDCGNEIDTLSTQVPFEYRERHAWNDDRTDVEHFLDLAQPILGSRRHDLRFAVGENVTVVPPPEFDGDDFADEILALGKGDGRSMLRSQISAPTGRLRRSRVLPLKDVGDVNRLRSLAESELRFARSLGSISELEVVDHNNARLGTFGSGDEIFVRAGGDGWFAIDMWVRIVAVSIRPEDDSRMKLTVVTSERV
jgi:hypothetical protein